MKAEMSYREEEFMKCYLKSREKLNTYLEICARFYVSYKMCEVLT